MRIEFTGAQSAEAVKLIRVLASFPCENDDEDDDCVTLERDRAEMCGSCHANQFLRELEGDEA